MIKNYSKMKKVFVILSAILLMTIITNETFANPKPWYIKIRIGLLAKWSIVLGDCQPGWGLCISIEDGSGQNYLGFEKDNNKFNLRITKSAPEARNLTSGVLEVQEDSPIDTKVISQFQNFSKTDKIVVIKKGTYKVLDDGDYLLIPVDYYLQ
jgi:hypothetical protein